MRIMMQHKFFYNYDYYRYYFYNTYYHNYDYDLMIII